MAKKKIPKKKEKVTKEKIAQIKPEEIKKIEESSKNKEETHEEEMEEPNFFETPSIETRTKKINPFLEESFATQDTPKDESLEESLAGVETKKKGETKEFYSQVSYGTKQGESDQKYGNPIHSGGIAERNEERGPMSVMDIRKNQFITPGLNPDVRKEIAEYTPHNSEEKYNVQNLERLDPTDLNRDRNRNPFLKDTERVEMKYE